jgi:hypothetical protein
MRFRVTRHDNERTPILEKGLLLLPPPLLSPNRTASVLRHGTDRRVSPRPNTIFSAWAAVSVVATHMCCVSEFPIIITGIQTVCLRVFVDLPYGAT